MLGFEPQLSSAQLECVSGHSGHSGRVRDRDNTHITITTHVNITVANQPTATQDQQRYFRQTILC